jgi:2-polyprenyl-6-methoxyphenol hydroxylase-like FAD-dependent oxidoreductase
MKPHVLIVGGGIAGPALAIFLNKAGITSTVFEAYPQADDIGGGMQIAPNGMRVLEQIGIADEVIAQGVESEEFSFENQKGKVLGRVPNGPASIYGIPAVLIARSVVHRALVSEAERRGIPILYGKRLHDLKCNAFGVIAEFEDGSAAEGTLLIGADGVHSRARELIFPDGPLPFYTGLFTVGGFASHPSLVPASRDELRRMHMIFGREGFFGYGRFNRQRPDTVIWWSHLSRDEDPKQQEYRSWPTETLRQELLVRHQGWQQPVITILESAPELLRGPVYDVPTLPAWSKNRVLLIGDAAHAISPHAGQGASLALEDAIALGKLLRNPEAGHEQAFAEFMRGRRSRVERVIAEARRRGDGKRTLTPTAAWIRDRVISALAHVLGARMNQWMYSYKVAWDG